MANDLLKNREIIFEFHPVGGIVKVTAMDTTTLTEVTVQCPAVSSEAVLKQHALKRLEYVLKKKGVVS